MSKGHKAGVWPLESEPRSPKFQWELQASSVLSTSVFALAIVFLPSGTKSSASPHWMSDCPQSQHHFSAGFPGAGHIDSQIRALQTLFSIPLTHIQICLGGACCLSRLLPALPHAPEVSRDRGLGAPGGPSSFGPACPSCSSLSAPKALVTPSSA